jgi:hypothetical protein
MTRSFVLAEIRLDRDGLADVLRREHGLEIAGVAGSSEEAAPLLRSGRWSASYAVVRGSGTP